MGKAERIVLTWIPNAICVAFLTAFAVPALAQNNAPVLDAGKSPVLSAESEDAGAPSGAVGTLVSSLVDFASPSGQVDNVTDVDAGAVLGIAVIGADTSSGSWFYSLNGGANWSALGSVSDSSARLLAADADNRLYFQPNANVNGAFAGALTIRAWDQTSGADGAPASAVINGGTTAFSMASDTVSLTITAVNDPPTASNLSAAESYTEDIARDLVDIVASDIDSAAVTATLVLSVPSAGSLTTATSGPVTSTYVPGTGTWTASGPIANVNVLLAGVSFVPAVNYNANLTIATNVSDGIGAVGGNKTMTGTAVNDAPVLDGSRSPVLSTEDEEAGAPSGAVGTLVASLVDFATPPGQVDNVTDPDGPLLGIAVTGADTSHGNWFFSLNNGGSWLSLGFINDSGARILAANATNRLYFQPNGNFNGVLGSALTIRAWDQSTGTDGTIWVATPNGGTTPFSADSDTVALTITAVNDPPTATRLSMGETYTEDTSLNLTDIVASDVDNATLTATLTLSSPTAGSLTTATSGPVTSTYVAGTGVWTASGPIANVNVLLAGVSYVPAANFNANFSIFTSVSDGTASVGGSKPMLGIGVNDAPVLDVSRSPALSAENEDAGGPSGTVGTLVSSLVDFAAPAGQVDNVTDVDNLALLGIAITGADTSQGSWHFSLNNGASWAPLGTVSDASARLLAANATNRLYFQPNANVNGEFGSALTIRAWDQISGADGATVSAATNGGATAFSSASDTVAITITAVNDPPTASNLSAAETYTENTSLDLIDIVASDVDNAMVTATLTLSNPAAGSLTTGTSGSVTSTYVAGTGIWTASGPIANVNALLAGVSYVPAAGFNASFSIATSVSDGSAATTGNKTMTSTSAPVGRVPDGTAGTPLLVSRNTFDAAKIDLHWAASCGAGGTDYAVYQGTIGTWYDHTSMLCSTGGALTATVTPDAGNHYYLVVALSSMKEGSYGTNSSGGEIPASAGPCRAVMDLAACP